MRTITVPAPIKIRTGTFDSTGRDIIKEERFATFLHDNILPRLGNKLRDIRRALKLYERFVDAPVGAGVHIDDADWDKLLEQLNQSDWNAFLFIQVDAFVRAIEDAVEYTP